MLQEQNTELPFFESCLSVRNCTRMDGWMIFFVKILLTNEHPVYNLFRPLVCRPYYKDIRDSILFLCIKVLKFGLRYILPFSLFYTVLLLLDLIVLVILLVPWLLYTDHYCKKKNIIPFTKKIRK